MTLNYDNKPWWQSKTIWFNIGTGLVAVGNEAAAFADAIPEAYSDQFTLSLGIVVAVGNVMLRLVTNKGVR